LINIFDSIPLVDLYTKDIILKTPLPTTEDIMKYESYLRSWLDNQRKILKQRLEAVYELATVCGKVTKQDAEDRLKYLEVEESRIKEMPD
jgi:16S rRNA A1518/A1519 N6-dimethyltransferase RsmA/KsgA/DIM1 with predicted DNA glycosylase/AP lyase activity